MWHGRQASGVAVKIGILSDLYIDEYGAPSVPREQPDVLVLAGDIGEGFKGLTWASIAYQCPIIYVVGNYSYRGCNLDTFDQELHSRAWGTNVHVLQNESLVVRGIRFIGSTLWSDFELFGDADTAKTLAQEGCVDYYRISKGGGEPITPADTAGRHREAVRYLEEVATQSFDDGSTVIVTHHAPSMKSVPPRYRDDHIAACYASHLDKLVERVDARFWVHGSQHDAVDYMLGGTRVLANPRGHPKEDAAREIGPFRPEYRLEI